MLACVSMFNKSLERTTIMVPETVKLDKYSSRPGDAEGKLPNVFKNAIYDGQSLAMRTSDSVGYPSPDDVLHSLGRELHTKATEFYQNYCDIANAAIKAKYPWLTYKLGFSPYPIEVPNNVNNGQKLTVDQAQYFLTNVVAYIPTNIGRALALQDNVSDGYAYQGSTIYGQQIVDLLRSPFATEIFDLYGLIEDHLVGISGKNTRQLLGT